MMNQLAEQHGRSSFTHEHAMRAVIMAARGYQNTTQAMLEAGTMDVEDTDYINIHFIDQIEASLKGVELDSRGYQTLRQLEEKLLQMLGQPMVLDMEAVQL